MSKELEIESKSMISKTDYHKLMEKFSNIENIVQTNYYISSPELESKLVKYGMRIRKIGHDFELTLKVSQEDGKLEINQEITRKSYANIKYFHIFPSGEVLDYLNENLVCDPSKLRIIGKMKTIRKNIDFLGSKISIDKSIYNHQVDYEVECEAINKKASENNLQTFLVQNLIKYKKSELTKLARFLNSKR